MVKVYLMLRNGRKNFECQWADPITGKLKTKSTNTPRKREAERFAGALAVEINSGEFNDAANTKWATAADRYENEELASRAVKTLWKFKSTRKAVEKIIDPLYVRAMTSSQVSQFQAGLRDKGLAEATIKSYLSALRSLLNWCHRIGLIVKMPHFSMPKRTGKMKHRPITDAEYKRMLDSVDAVATPRLANEWKFLLQGLWTSGLRLDEALRLRWDQGEITVNLTGQRPRLKIEANADKSTKPRLLPIAPDFAELLLTVDPSQRQGRVFRPVYPGQVLELRLDSCSKFITSIGEKAEICVGERPPKGEEKEPRKSWAGAHCFRRAFGTRWSKRLRPQQLQELMRHETIATTMTFYVEDDIIDVEDAAWLHATNSLSNTPESVVTEATANP